MAGDPSGAHVAFSFSAKGPSRRDPSGRQSGRQAFHLDRPQPGAAVLAHPHRGRLQVWRRRRAMPARFPPKRAPAIRVFLAAFRRGRTAHVEVENAAVMQMSTGYFAHRLHPQASIGNVDAPDAWLGLNTSRVVALRKRAFSAAPRGAAARTGRRRGRAHSPTDFAWLRGPKRRPPENAGARAPSPG